jgi:cephalosporin hydroxylase
LVKLATRGYWHAISPIQNPREILALLGILKKARPRRILEIGTASGGTLFLFTRIAAADAGLVSIDLPGGPGGGGYPPWKIPLYQAFP